MTKIRNNIVLLAFTIGLTGSVQADDERSVVPAKISKAELTGKIFDRPDAATSTVDGVTTIDVTTFMSSDEKFGSGMFKIGKLHYEQTEPLGFDEFIYITEGSLTITSSDGTVQVINAGEAVTIGKQWTGRWDSAGFTQIWVVYSEDGSGLQ